MPPLRQEAERQREQHFTAKFCGGEEQGRFVSHGGPGPEHATGGPAASAMGEEPRDTITTVWAARLERRLEILETGVRPGLTH